MRWDRPSTPRPMPLLTSTTLPTASSSSDITNSPTIPTTRDPNFSVTLPQKKTLRPSGSSQLTRPQLTGEQRVPSPQSRTKDSADPAGPSPPLVPSRVFIRLSLESSNLSLSSKSSIALTLDTDTQASDATVETSPLLSSISKRIRLNWNPSTHTPQRTELASTKRALPLQLTFPNTPKSLLTTLSRWRLPSHNSQSLFPLKLTRWSSSSTRPESSIHPSAEPSLITPLSLLATDHQTEPTTGSWRTLGDPPGENKDTCNSRSSTETVSAESRWDHSSQPPTEFPETTEISIQSDLLLLYKYL